MPSGTISNSVAEHARRLPILAAVGVVRAWQLCMSPVIGPTCRFHPTCSHYAIEALRSHGLLRGGWLTIRRIARCHPWHPGGLDPVPPTADESRRHVSPYTLPGRATDELPPETTNE